MNATRCHVSTSVSFQCPLLLVRAHMRVEKKGKVEQGRVSGASIKETKYILRTLKTCYASSSYYYYYYYHREETEESDRWCMDCMVWLHNSLRIKWVLSFVFLPSFRQLPSPGEWS